MSGSIGECNPCPFECGGGPTTLDQIAEALKQMVGRGGSAADGTIEAAWRYARATAIYSAQATERALAQFFPDTASTYLEVWEDVLGITTNTALPDATRAAAVHERLARQIDAAAPGLEDTLQEIDTRFVLLHQGRDTTRCTEPGRAFEDWLPADPDADGPPYHRYGLRKCTAYPNYSDDFCCIVQFTIPAGAIPSGEQQRAIAQAAGKLCEVLPAWVDFRFVTDVGFYLDSSPLDIGAFGPS